MLDIEMEFRRGVLFIRLKGNLIETTNIKLKNEIYKIINRSGITNIVINLENINIVDDIGMNTIYEIEAVVKRKNGNLVICNMTDRLFKSKSRICLYKSQNELTALNTFNI